MTNSIDVAFQVGFQKEAQKPLEDEAIEYQASQEEDSVDEDYSRNKNAPSEAQTSNFQGSGEDSFSGAEEMGAAGLEAFSGDEESPTIQGMESAYNDMGLGFINDIAEMGMSDLNVMPDLKDRPDNDYGSYGLDFGN